ncbi:disulfide bond formation protein B [Castellaniella sp. GW247-6E4]|uniref:disulfide bond formation protein B n=1 Tax=Castellaniella sp. GW247-6E4 TaxID=3140380 RepID=UPI003315C951
MAGELFSDSRRMSGWVNAIGLAAVCGVLLMAFVWQVVYDELPCPLCLLQRVGFVMVGIGLLLNVRFGPSPLHYALILFSALAGAFAAGRQVLLHIAPDDVAGYGSPFLGLHFYTWAFVLFVLTILWTAVMLVFDRTCADSPRARVPGKVARAIIWLFFILVAANLVSTLLECGVGACPDDPVSYLWWPR